MVWSSVIECVAFEEMFPAASLYWTQTVFEPSPEESVKETFALYGLTAVNGVTKVALEQSLERFLAGRAGLAHYY